MKRFFYLLFILTVASCEPFEDEGHHAAIKVINNTDIEVYVFNDTQSQSEPNHKPFSSVLYQGDNCKLNAREVNTSALCLSRSYWESVLAQSSDSVWVYFLRAEVIKANPEAKDEAVLGYYVVSLNDLKNIDWTIAYPPTGEMKNVKMFPSYDEWVKRASEGKLM